MWPAVLCIPYATSSHETNGDMINFARFEEGIFLVNKQNLFEDELISDSIDDPYEENI